MSELKIENGKWKTENGKWKTENKLPIAYCLLPIA